MKTKTSLIFTSELVFASLSGLILALLCLLIAACVSGVNSFEKENLLTEEILQTDEQKTNDLELIIKTLDYINIKNPLYGHINTYGSSITPVMCKGSVIAYLIDELIINTDTVISLDPEKSQYAGLIADNEQTVLEIEKEGIIRTGMIKPSIKYIVYHDTENNNAGADALMNIRYMQSSGNTRSRSWHYTVDDTGIWQTIPDNEAAWHGDSYLSYAYSIGIETCVNKDSDLFLTWQLAAKLAAYLIDQYNLTPDEVIQHFDIMRLSDLTGKDCPKTIRRAGLWAMTKHLITGEYMFLQNINRKGYKIEFINESEKFIDNKGRLHTLPPAGTPLMYTIRVISDNTVILERSYISVYNE